MNLRRILLIALFALISIGLGFLLYFFFFRAPKEGAEATPEEKPGITGSLTPAAPGTPPKTGGLSGGANEPSAIAKGGLTLASVVVAAPTLGARLSSDGSTLLSYDRSSGKFLRVREDGTVINISNKSFLNVENVEWAADGKRAVIEFPDGSNIVYDFESEKSVTLPKHWQDFNFSPDGSKLVGKSIGADPENRWLVTVDSDGSNAKVIESLGENADKVQVSWSPSGSVVAFSATGRTLGMDRQEILLIGQNSENFKGLEVAGMGFRPLWSPSGTRLLWSTYSSQTSYRPQLWTALASGDEIGGARRSFPISTWADKCAFADEKTVYCAVPKNTPEGIGFQPELANSIPDKIYRIDLETGSAILIAEPEGNYSIKNIAVTTSERMLYFTDNGSGSVHQIKLQ